MIRTITNSLLVTIILFGSISFITACKNKVNSDKYRLIWYNNPSNSITVGWNQKVENSNPTVYYDTVDYGKKYWNYSFKQVPQFRNHKYGMKNTFAELYNLIPDKKYYFIIKDDKGISERFYFYTAPSEKKAFTFISGGDTKSEGIPLEVGRTSNKMVSKLRPLFVIFNGDFCSGDGTNSEYWQQWLDDWFNYTTTNDGRLIPIIPVHGNHENGDKANLNYIFNVPFQNSDSSQIFYSTSFGKDFFYFVSLNTEIEKGGEQLEWLSNDLEINKNCLIKIVGYHKPFFPHTAKKSENFDQFKLWAYLFKDFKVNISLDGDSHMSKITFPIIPDTLQPDSVFCFVRNDSLGTVYIGEGSWGAKPRINDDDKPWTYKSGTFNQIKWFHVIPDSGKINIFTVITSKKNGDEFIPINIEIIEDLFDSNTMRIPQNIVLDTINSDEDIKFTVKL